MVSHSRSKLYDATNNNPPVHRTVASARRRATPSIAQYSARRNGDAVQLEDTKNQTVVSIVPSVGNITFEMKVKGQNVLRWPYPSLEEFKARPTQSGIPFLGPWANRLDEQAFYANGKKYSFDMTLGNVRGAIPIHGFLTTNDQWQRGRDPGRRETPHG